MMRRLKLEPKDIEHLGFTKEYEIVDQFKFNKGDRFTIRINGTQFEAHRFDENCPFTFYAPMENMTTEILRNILKWNADVLYNDPPFYCENISARINCFSQCKTCESESQI